MNKTLFALLSISLAAPAHAGCEVGRAMLAGSQQAVDQKTQQAQADAEAVLAQVKTQGQQGNGQTCLEQLQNIGITASAGLPSIESVGKAIKQAAEGQACQVAIGQINRAIGAANGEINRTGINQIPGVAVGVGTNSQGGISTTIPDTSPQAAGGIWNKIQSIFR